MGLAVAAYDVDGMGSPDNAVNGADVSLVAHEALQVLGSGTARARDDYNGDSRVNAADVAMSSAMALEQMAGTGSRNTGPFCP